MAEMDDIKESLKRLEAQLERERQDATGRLQNMQKQIELLKSQLAFVPQSINKTTTPSQASVNNPAPSTTENKPPRGYPPPPKPVQPTTATSTQVTTPSQATNHIPPKAQTTAPQKSYDWSQWEMIIGGNWLARIGIIVVALGLIFFMKFSFDNNLISPQVRIFLSLLAGVAMAGFGESLFRKKYTEQAQVLYAGSIFTFYTTILLAKYYPFNTGVVLENNFIALVLMVGTSSYAYVLALRFESQVIAAIGLVGAYLSPFLVGKSTGKMVPLLTYLTIISVTLLPLTARKQWQKLFLTGILLACIEPIALMLSLPTSPPFIESSWLIVASALLYAAILFTLILFQKNIDQGIEFICLPIIGILLPLLLTTHNLGIINDPFMFSYLSKSLNMGTATLLYYIYLFYLFGLALYHNPTALYYLVPGAFFIILIGIPGEVKNSYWYLVYGTSSFTLLAGLFYVVKKDLPKLGVLTILHAMAIAFMMNAINISFITSKITSTIAIYYLLFINLTVSGFLFFKNNPGFKRTALIGTAAFALIQISVTTAYPHEWAVISLIFLLYHLSDFLQNYRRQFSFQLNDIFYLLGTPSFYLLFSLPVLKMHNEPMLAPWCLMVASIYALQGYYLYHVYLKKEPAPIADSRYYQAVLLYLGICLSFITLGIFYLLKHQYITLAWTVECALVFYFAYDLKEIKLKRFALFLLTIIFIRFLGIDSLIPNTNTHFLLNVSDMAFYLNNYTPFYESRFIVGLTTCGLLFYLSYLQGRHGTRKEFALFSFVCGNILLLALLSTETAAWIMQFNEDAFLAKYRALIYSILWSVHATLLLILGFRIHLQSIRIMGLILFGIILAKVFAYDIWGFSQGIRIIAFIFLGILLILSSLLYSRNKKQA